MTAGVMPHNLCLRAKGPPSATAQPPPRVPTGDQVWAASGARRCLAPRGYTELWSPSLALPRALGTVMVAGALVHALS